MCGIVGSAGQLEFKDENNIKRLLIVDYIRGPDSTGLASIKLSGEAMIAKGAVAPPDLFDQMKFKATLNGCGSKVFIGHNRAATRGKVNNTNAHPFEFDDIVGCHNGTLDGPDKKLLEEIAGEEFDVDSAALFAAIAKVGIEKIIPKLTVKDGSNGAWSLVWYDRKDDTINFLRNKHRPMFYAFEKGFKKLIWASEWRMIDLACSMGGYELEAYAKVKDGMKFKFFPTDEDTHYKLPLDKLRHNTEGKLPKFSIKKLAGKEPAPVSTTQGSFPLSRPSTQHGTQNSGNTSQQGGRTGTHTQGSTKGNSSTMTSRGPKRSPLAIHLTGTNDKPMAGYIPETQFMGITRYGCPWCGRSINWGDPGLTVFEKEDVVLCNSQECSGHEPFDPEGEHLPATRIYVDAATIAAMS